MLLKLEQRKQKSGKKLSKYGFKRERAKRYSSHKPILTQKFGSGKAVGGA